MKTALIGKKHTPLVIGNWKQNPPTLIKALQLSDSLKKTISKKNVLSHVCIAVPSVYLTEVHKRIRTTRMTVCAQDCSHEDGGAHTGEVSATMLKSVDVTHVIIGHSERRAQGESDERVAAKVGHALKAGLTTIVCIGEKKRDSAGDYFGVVESQVRAVLKAVPPSALGRFVIAYEPVWAIGTGKHATSEDVQEMKLFIQKILADVLNRQAVRKVRILYGGSVNKDNAENLFVEGRVDGFLVGGASLKAEEFAYIVNVADTYGKK